MEGFGAATLAKMEIVQTTMLGVRLNTESKPSSLAQFPIQSPRREVQMQARLKSAQRVEQYTCVPKSRSSSFLNNARELERSLRHRKGSLRYPPLWRANQWGQELKAFDHKKGIVQCSSDGAATVDYVPTDGSSEDYPILYEVADVSEGEWARQKKKVKKLKNLESTVERLIFDCRFFALMGVAGSLIGAFLCFVKGCCFVFKAVQVLAYDFTRGITSYKVVLKLIEALDTYLVATVMLIFGVGLYELFINELEAVGPSGVGCKSNMFGLFRLRERPRWLQINGLDSLKEKLGHVIVMILLVGMFEKSKKVPVRNGIDLLCVATSVLLCAGSLYLLSHLSR